MLDNRDDHYTTFQGLYRVFRSFFGCENNFEKFSVLFRFPEPKNDQTPTTQKCGLFCRFCDMSHAPTDVSVFPFLPVCKIALAQLSREDTNLYKNRYE